MILEVVQSKWSLTWYDPLGPRMCVLELMNGHVLQTLREQLKVPGSRLEGSELLTSEFLRFRSRLNETSGGLGKIGAVSGSDCRILKFLRIRTVTYCTRLPTHLTSKTQFRTPNFSDSVGSAAKIQTFTPNATKCRISFPNVAILTASCL